MKKISFLILALAVVLCGRGVAQPVIPEALKDNIKARVDYGVNPAIVLAVIQGKDVSYFDYGVKSLKTKEPVNEKSVFEIGSITKTFTGILLADRVLKGEVSLSDPLQNYLPAGVTAPTRNGAAIQLIHLANHTSALPRMPFNFAPANPANPFADYSEKLAYEFLNSYQLPRDIGAQYEYSNYAMGLLGHVLATKKQTTYEDLVVTVVATPLQMNDTRITFTPTMKANLAMGHHEGVEVENWDLTSLAGAGAIRSTAADMVKYVQANMGSMKTDLYPAMQLSHKNTRPEGSAPMVALGWHKANGEDVIWHNGGTGGYRTFIGFTKDGSKGVVVLSNSTASVDDIGMHVLNASSPLKDPRPAPKAPKEEIKEVAVEAAVLQTYAGKYELAPSFVLTVRVDGGQLKAQASGQPEFPVFAKAKNIFFYKVVEAQLTFNSNAGGTVESVTLHQGGQMITGKKMAD